MSTFPAPVRFAAVLAIAGPAGLAAADEPIRDHEITLDDYFTQVYVSDMAVAPDGRHVAYVEGRWDKELDRRNMDLWVVATGSRRVTRLTFDPGSDAKPRWGADGAWVYHLAKRERTGEEKPPYDNSQQVWRVRVDGSEAMPVTRVADGVLGYELSGDGRTLYYVTGKKHVEPDAWKPLREEFSDLEYGHGVAKFGVLWQLDLETWRVEKLVDEDRVIGAFTVSPDERRIAMVTTPTEELITNEGWSHVDVYDTRLASVTRLDDQLWRDAAPSPFGWIVDPTWSTDGAKLAFRVDFDGYPGELFAAHFDDARPGGVVPVSKLTRPEEVSAEGRMAWMPRTHDVCFLADDHARKRLYRIPQVTAGGHGPGAVLTPGDVVVDAFGFSADGRTLAVLKSDPAHMPDLFLVQGFENGAGDVRYERVTKLNPQVDRWKLPQLRVVGWTSPDGTEVEGILELPPDHQPGDPPLPMVVTIHGGPTASSKYAQRFWIYGRTLFAAKGWAVFDPNYRGSTGYGDRFLTDLIENKNNLDVQDILAGVDMLVREGIADPDRLGVTGWSNGGYLTNCLITATDRFKAASSGAGVFDTVMQWSIEDTPGHVINYSGGLPWERSAKMHDTSPLYDVDKVVTPTLIHVGENDERVPVEHSRALHRALHHYLDVPSELVVYPGTGHGLRKYSHRRAKMMWDHRWFDHYVLGKSAEESPP